MIRENFALCLLMLVFFSRFAKGDEDPERIGFRCSFHENRKFLVVQASGDGSTRNAHITVFEVLGPDHSLRRLHSCFLANKCSVNSLTLCGSGRFLVTANHMWWNELRYPLAIYDLVRNEHTTYDIDDLFSPELQLAIRKTTRTEDLKILENWSQTLGQSEDHFDPKTLSFTIYPAEPAPDGTMLIAQESFAFPSQFGENKFVKVVIDLPTRVAKAVRCDNVVDIFEEYRKLDHQEDSIESLNQQSIKDAIFDLAGKRILLPEMVYIPNLNSPMLYRLNTQTLEYRKAELSEWKGEKKVYSGCKASHDKELRELIWGVDHKIGK